MGKIEIFLVGCMIGTILMAIILTLIQNGII